MMTLLVGTSSAAFCGKLGSFDAVCLKDDIVFIVSVSPCRTMEVSHKIDRTVHLTIIDTRNKMKQKDLSVQKPITRPLDFGE